MRPRASFQAYAVSEAIRRSSSRTGRSAVALLTRETYLLRRTPSAPRSASRGGHSGHGARRRPTGGFPRRGRVNQPSPSDPPKITAVLTLIVLILVGVGLIAMSLAMLRRRQSAEGQKAQSEGSEKEVYDRIYGKRSLTVSAPVPIEPQPEADGDTPRAGLSE